MIYFGIIFPIRLLKVETTLMYHKYGSSS